MSRLARVLPTSPRALLVARALAATLAVVIGAALLAPSPARAGDPAKAERQALAKIAKEWTDLGKWCAAHKLPASARAYAERAAVADPAATDLAGLRAALGADTPDEKDAKEHETRAKAAAKRAASGWDAVVGGLKPDDAAGLLRGAGFALEAIALEADAKRWARFLAFADAFLALKDPKKDGAAAGVLADRALALGPPEKLVPKVQRFADAPAIDGLVLRKAAKHAIKYWFSLPRGFERGKKKWPILVCVDGAGSNFEGMGRSYATSRGDLPYMVVSPCTFSNTNQISGDAGQTAKYGKLYPEDVVKDGDTRRLDWDEEGILAVLDELQATYDADSKCYVTGFSGGGIATYMMLCKHPDRVFAAAPACGNFRQGEYLQLKGKFAAADLALPVLIFTGEKDEHRELTFGKKEGGPGIEPQTDSAVKILEELGYKLRKRTMVPGMGHSPAVDQVIGAFKPYLLGTKKRGEL